MIWSVCGKLGHKRKALTSEEVMELDYVGELYTSLCYYDEYLYDYLAANDGSLERYDGKTYGHYFVLDLDGSKDQIAQVSAAVVTFMKYLDHRGVRYYAFFSGKKGYHFYIPNVYVEYSDTYDGQWHKAGRQFAVQIMEEIIELQPWLDLKVYDRSRQFRFPFSRHPELYNGKEARKTLVRLDEKARYGIGLCPCNQAAVLRDIFNGMHFTGEELGEIETIMTLEEPKSGEELPSGTTAFETVTVGELVVPEDEKVCIYRMMHDNDCEGRRHDISMILMAYWREKRLPPQFIAANLTTWNRGLKKPMSETDISTTLKYWDRYTFTCDDPIKQRYCSKDCRFSKSKGIGDTAAVTKEKVNIDLTTQIRDWITASEGTFMISDLYAAFMLNTRSERNHCSMILHRLVQEGIIQRYGNKKGAFRVVIDDCPEMDWRNASSDPLPIRWPFGLESLVDTMPKNIIMLAGESNAGKTTFLLNVARMNMNTFDVHYFNSEMAEGEFKNRLALFEDMTLDDWKIHPYERSDNFPDVIRPNGFNIIDYLELHDEFWRIGGIIKAIHDKLDKGICIIAIQKDPQKDFGKGGAVTIEKPRLYLNMTPGKLLIKKAKQWRNRDVNPNGMSLVYNVINGSKLYSGGVWERRTS